MSLFRHLMLVASLASSLVARDEVQPLPEPAALLERVVASAKTLAPRREAYVYLHEETLRKLDRRGLPKKTETKTYEVTMLPGGQIRRLVAEDGQALSEARAKAEEVRVQARLKAIFARITVVPVRMETSFRCSGFRRFEMEETQVGKATLVKAD